MNISINKIEIRNFRSIKKIALEVKDIALLVGKNDAGKSNILRALNLFFNGETNVGMELDFDKDFCVTGGVNRKADEILVRLELKLPDNYKRTNGDLLIWEKYWRRDSSETYHEEYYGIKLSYGKRKKEKRIEKKIPAKSRLHAALRRINFEYIPAIKNTHYFDSLRGEIYHTIASVAQKSLHKSSKSFEQDIGKHVQELISSLSSSLGYGSQLSLPKNLSGVFEKLDFISSEGKISLDQKGDGIKARHIPHILHFMAEKEKTLAGQGSPRYTVIWGYEEPENNLEIPSCVDLANEINTFVGQGVSQAIITTHSPIFYNIGKENSNRSSVHQVIMNEVAWETEVISGSDSIDDLMGTTALFAEKTRELQKKLKGSQENNKVFQELINNSKKSRIFVEGTSDKILFEKILTVFAPDHADDILVETKEGEESGGGGFLYVIDMLSHWRSRHKYYNSDPKAAGIVDRDAKNVAEEWNNVNGNTESGKCFPLPQPKKCQEFLATDFDIVVVLETLYSDDVWKYAQAKGWLEELGVQKFLKETKINQIIEGEKSKSDFINTNTPLFITHKFKKFHKTAVAKHLARKSDADFKKLFTEIEPWFSGIVGKLTQ